MKSKNTASATNIDHCGGKGCGMIVTATDPDRTIVRGIVFHKCCVPPDHEAESIATMFKALHDIASFVHHEDKVKLAMAETTSTVSPSATTRFRSCARCGCNSTRCSTAATFSRAHEPCNPVV